MIIRQTIKTQTLTLKNVYSVLGSNEFCTGSCEMVFITKMAGYLTFKVLSVLVLSEALAIRSTSGMKRRCRHVGRANRMYISLSHDAEFPSLSLCVGHVVSIARLRGHVQ